MKRWIGVLCILYICGCSSGLDMPTTTASGSKIYKDKLAADKILDVSEPDGSKTDAVGIMAGIDGDHLVRVVIYRSQVAQGFQTTVPVDISAYNGNNTMYINSPEKFNTEVLVVINSLDHKTKRASITISGRLVSNNPDDHSYLDITPAPLSIIGKQFDNLIGKQ